MGIRCPTRRLVGRSGGVSESCQYSPLGMDGIVARIKSPADITQLLHASTVFLQILCSTVVGVMRLAHKYDHVASNVSYLTTASYPVTAEKFSMSHWRWPIPPAYGTSTKVSPPTLLPFMWLPKSGQDGSYPLLTTIYIRTHPRHLFFSVGQPRSSMSDGAQKRVSYIPDAIILARDCKNVRVPRVDS